MKYTRNNDIYHVMLDPGSIHSGNDEISPGFLVDIYHNKERKGKNRIQKKDYLGIVIGDKSRLFGYWT